MSQPNPFKIGVLAQKTDLPVGTLRYYSDFGLLLPVTRGNNGYRYYNQDAVQQVEFIKKAQILGFTLEEIRQILDVRDRGEKPCNLVQSLLERKIKEIQAKIEGMTIFKAELEGYRDTWTKNSNIQTNPNAICPLISSVSLKC